MRCNESRLAAYLAHELSDEDARALEQHLLGCDECWRAVQLERAGHQALELLREPAPIGLGDRIAMAVEVQERSAVPARRWTPSATRAPARRRVAYLAVGLVAASVLSVLGLELSGGSGDPPQIAAVMAMMTPNTTPPSALLSGEHRMIDHQMVSLRAVVVHGEEAIVAISQHPFPMPQSSHLLAGSSEKAWMATDGSLSMYGINRADNHSSMFLVSTMPMAELPELAARLKLL